MSDSATGFDTNWKSFHKREIDASGPQVFEFSTVDELLAALRDPRFAGPIFRGTKDADFALTPSALRDAEATDLLRRFSGFRAPDDDRDLTSTFHQFDYESIAIARFFQVADQQGLHLPDDGRLLRVTYTSVHGIGPVSNSTNDPRSTAGCQITCST